MSTLTDNLQITLPPPIKQAPRTIVTLPTDDPSTSSTLYIGGYVSTTGIATGTVTPTPDKGMYIVAAGGLAVVLLLFLMKK